MAQMSTCWGTARTKWAIEDSCFYLTEQRRRDGDPWGCSRAEPLSVLNSHKKGLNGVSYHIQIMLFRSHTPNRKDKSASSTLPTSILKSAVSGNGEMALRLRALTYSSCQGPQFSSQYSWRQFTTTCNSSSRSSDAPSGLWGYLYVCICAFLHN